MRAKFNPLVSAMLGLGLAAPATSVLGSNLALEEVVVTAQKRSESAQDVGMSISAMSGEDLKANGVSDPNDLGKVVSGFVYTKTPRGTPVFALRGIGFDDSSLGSASTVATYLDEVPMAYPVMSRFTMFDLAQVEVLKGPQGILFGQNSTGGAVNFIAAKPSEEFEAGIDASYGRFQTLETSGFVSGQITEGLTARASIQAVQSGEGWQESYTRNDELGEQDAFAARLLANWDVNDKLSMQFALHGWVDKSDTQAGQLTEVHHSVDATSNPEYDAYPRSPNDARAADWDANPDQPLVRDDSFMQSSVRIDYSLSDNLTFTSITAYSDYEQDFNQDTDGSDLQNFSLSNFGSIESISQEFRLTGETDAVRWIVGLNFAEDETEDNTIYYFDENSVSTAFQIDEAISTANQDVETRAIFGNAAWDVGETVTLNVGARYTEDERSYVGCTGDTGDGQMATAFNALWLAVYQNNNNLQPGDCTTADNGVAGLVRRELDEDNVSWRGGIDWQMNDDVLTYLNISKGFKSGAVPSVNSSEAKQVSVVTQESVLAYELGFKSSLMDSRMRLNGALFRYDYEDKQLRGRISDPVFGPLETLVNIPESLVYGAEIGFEFLVSEGLTVALNGSYTRTKVTDDFMNFDPLNNEINYKGLSFPLTPELHVSARVSYERPINDQWLGFVSVNVLHKDETTGLFYDEDVFANTQISPVLRPGEMADPDLLKVDGYTTVDMRLGVQSSDGKWEAALWGRNLTDEYYWNNATQGLDNFYRLSAMPRTYGISVAYRF